MLSPGPPVHEGDGCGEGTAVGAGNGAADVAADEGAAEMVGRNGEITAKSSAAGKPWTQDGR